MSIAWSPWSGEAFARARAESKPILLFIAASWCQWCREMDRSSFADPAVARRARDEFVAVRVDADKRPDISERYALGGVPTTVFLTGDGDILGGGTFVPADRLAAALEQVVGAYSSRAEEIAARARAGGNAASAPTAAPRPDDLLAAVLESYDPEHGGFGRTPKFPLTAPLQLALRLREAAVDSPLRLIAEHTLDAMAEGGLYDAVDGGFFRYAASRDWRSPHYEKLLEVNAGLLRLYLDAADLLRIARYRDRAADILRYIQTWLADPVDGGWAGSQQADADYYSRSTAGERGEAAAPAVDQVLYAGWNAVMASAALRASESLRDPDLGLFALKSLERVLLACYRPGEGVAHYFDGAPQVRGLLDDQVWMASAALDAAEATGSVAYEMMAEELAFYMLRTMWDEADGGFFDRAAAAGDEAVGLLRRPMKPFVSNCEAARLLLRLAATSGHHELADRARAALAAVAGLAAAQGPLAAHYLLAMREAGDGDTLTLLP